MILYEHRVSQRRSGRPSLVAQDDLHELRGFQSVFGFPQATADFIERTGRTAGLDKLPLFCDTLFLDFDDKPESEKAALDWLRQNECQYKLYHTGGRGQHVHIPIRPIEGLSTLSSIKDFVEKTFPGADLSIYKTSGIYRLPGTFHEKYPGRRKELVALGGTRLLEVPEVQPATPVLRYSADSEGSQEDQTELAMALMRRAEEGSRNVVMYTLARRAREAGLDYFETMALAAQYNDLQICPPLDSKEVLTSIISAFR